MSQRLLVTGASGQLGWELLRSLAPLGVVTAVDRQALDLARPDMIREVLREVRPHVVVNPAAYTAVDRAETERDLAWAINATAPGILAMECRAIGARLIHFSTDYVFDGSSADPWQEDDATGPLNVYGASKLAGEQAIAATGCEHLILRTSWVYSLHGANFLKTLIRLAQTRESLRIVSDQVGAPTSAPYLADLTAQMIGRWQARPGAGGVVHATCSGATSWHGFANAIVDRLLEQPANQEAFRITRRPRIDPIPASDYPTPARRPANSRLDLTRLEKDWALHALDWEAALALVLRDA